jgi:hypothetical protein
MATTLQFASVAKNSSVLVSAANTNRDGTGTLATVVTAGSAGTRIERIILAAIGTTTAGMLRLYIHNGTSAFLWKEIPVTALTPSGTVQAFQSELDCATTAGQIMVLPSGWSIRCSTHNAESFHVTAIGGDF